MLRSGYVRESKGLKDVAGAVETIVGLNGRGDG